MPNSNALNNLVLAESGGQRLMESVLGAANALGQQVAAFEAYSRRQPADALTILSAADVDFRQVCDDSVMRKIVYVALREGFRRAGDSEFVLIESTLDRYRNLLDPDQLATVLREAGDGRHDAISARGLTLVRRKYPRHVGLCRLAADAAVAKGDSEQAEKLLSQLGRLDASSATRNQIMKIRRTLSSPDSAGVRVALLSSYTMDLLIPHLDFSIRELGLTADLFIGPFGAWAQEFLAPQSGLKQFQPDIVFLAVSIDDLMPELAGAMSLEQLQRQGASALDRLLGVIRTYSASSDVPLVVHGFHSAHPDPLGIARPDDPEATRTAWLNQLNMKLAVDLHALHNVHLLDMSVLLQRRRDGAFENPKMRHLASLRLSENMLGELAQAYARYIAPVKGLTKKCIVLDLDNTLWGGIVGEDGQHGIKLGKTAPGSEFREFQLFLKSLTTRGFLLAINSKNNLDDVLPVLRMHEDMILREDDFSAMRINWTPKHENMLSMARELNIGVDSFVFVDDNPKEREFMRQMLPQVLVPEMPVDPALYRGALEGLPQLQTVVVTAVDRERAAQYRANRQRDAAKTDASSLDDYLHSLELLATITLADDASVPRVHQLFQRTNQFNMTTRRYDLPEVAGFAANPALTRLYTMNVRDRFGDHGLVGVALVRVGASHWLVDSFLMSCRVIGYGAETCLLAQIVDDARRRAVTKLAGEFQETKKNVPARDFYQRHGFIRSDAAGPVESWRLDLLESDVTKPQTIKVETNGA